jgi:hypothetical protein
MALPQAVALAVRACQTHFPVQQSHMREAAAVALILPINPLAALAAVELAGIVLQPLGMERLI